jgi:hypothetical protein
MVKRVLLIALILSFPVISIAQTFTEITEGGWGQGIKDTKAFFIDLDNDDLLDVIIGEYDGSLHHYEQNTLNSTSFTLVSRQFSAIDVGLFAAPVFTDLDADGLLDLIIGEQDGNLNHYEQYVADSDSFALITEEFNLIDVGNKSIPSFIDLDYDGLQDLILSSQDGTMYHYEQDTVDPMVFTLISDNFSGISAGFFGTVCFTDLDHDSLYDMITGRNPGPLKHYEQDALGSSNFSLVSDYFNEIDVGANSAATFTDLDRDGLLDLVVGEMNGHLHHFEQEEVDSTTFLLISENLLGIYDVGYDSAPSFTDLDNDGLVDMVVGEYRGTLSHYEQDDIGSESFNLISPGFCGINMDYNPDPCFCNLDNDGLHDLIIGNKEGDLHYYEQEETGSNNFILISDSLSGIAVGDYSAPGLADIDQDGLLDMLVGEYDGNLNHYEQDAAGSTTFTLISENFNEIDAGNYSAPHITDLDDDGLLDLIVGHSSNTLFHYEQESAGSTVFILLSDNLINIVRGRELKPVSFDLNQDGVEDLFVGESWGGIHYFRGNDGTFVDEEQGTVSNVLSYRLHTNYPNPFNPATELQYDLPEPSEVDISVYNIQGQTVKVLYKDFQQAGSHTVRWDGKDENNRSLTSGLYICRMQAGEFHQSIKLMLIR